MRELGTFREAMSQCFRCIQTLRIFWFPHTKESHRAIFLPKNSSSCFTEIRDIIYCAQVDLYLEQGSGDVTESAHTQALVALLCVSSIGDLVSKCSTFFFSDELGRRR